MPNPPYLPTTIAGLLAWGLNFVTLLSAAPASYGLSAGDATACQDAYDAWEPVQNQALSPDTKTKAITAEAAALKADFLAIVRPRATSISSNASVSAELKTGIGVTLPTSVRTNVTPPTSAPTLSLVAVGVGTVKINYQNPETPNSKKAPRGCGGVALYISFGTAAATDPTSAPLFTRLTKSPGTINVPGQAGKVATIWGRFETKNGVAGGQVGMSPFSAPLVVVCN